MVEVKRQRSLKLKSFMHFGVIVLFCFKVQFIGRKATLLSLVEHGSAMGILSGAIVPGENIVADWRLPQTCEGCYHHT